MKPRLEKIDLSKIYQDEESRCLHPNIKEGDQFLALNGNRGWECGTAEIAWYGITLAGLCDSFVELDNFFTLGFTELYRIQRG